MWWMAYHFARLRYMLRSANNKKKKLRKGQNNNNNTSSNERSESHLLITNQVEILPNFIAYTS